MHQFLFLRIHMDPYFQVGKYRNPYVKITSLRWKEKASEVLPLSHQQGVPRYRLFWSAGY